MIESGKRIAEKAGDLPATSKPLIFGAREMLWAAINDDNVSLNRKLLLKQCMTNKGNQELLDDLSFVTELVSNWVNE